MNDVVVPTTTVSNNTLDMSRVNPDAAMCDVWMTRKKRFCNFPKKHQGGRWCGVHSGLTTDGDADDRRVPCPINPNHTVRQRELKRHVRMCPDLRFVPTQLPCFVLDRHAGESSASAGGGEESATPAAASSSAPPRVTHRQLSQEALAAFIRKIERVYAETVQGELQHLNDDPDTTTGGTRLHTVPSVVLSAREALQRAIAHAGGVAALAADDDEHDAHPSTDVQQHAAGGDVDTVTDDVEAEAAARQTAAATGNVLLKTAQTKKHTPQHLGLVSLMEAIGTVPPAAPTADGVDPTRVKIVEPGAGKAGLCLAVAERWAQCRAESDDSSSSAGVKLPWMLVVDRGNFRRKGDGRCRDAATGQAIFERCRIDLKDFDLDKYLDSRPAASAPPPASNVCDHHYAFVGKHLCGACTDFALSLASTSRLPQAAARSIVIATCCHQTCEWRHMLPQQRKGGAASATALETGSAEGVRSPAAVVADRTLQRLLHEEFPPQEFPFLTSLSSWAVSGEAAVSQDQAGIGRKAKRILDHMRVLALRRLGWEAFTVHFVAESVTRENAAIVARCAANDH